MIRNSLTALILVLLLATQVMANGYASPLDLQVYEQCPQPVTFTARIGQIAGAAVGIPLGLVGGIIAIPFNGFDAGESVSMGIFSGMMVMSIGGSAITGAPAYGIYRLFNWDGCK